MSKSLIINRSYKNWFLKHSSSLRIDSCLTSRCWASSSSKFQSTMWHLPPFERRCIKTDCLSSNWVTFCIKALKYMSYSHSRRNAMRVDNQIRYNSIDCPRHILLTKEHSYGPFLTMSRSKFIPNFRNPNLSCLNLNHLIVITVTGYHSAIDNSILISSNSNWSINGCWNFFRFHHLIPKLSITESRYKFFGDKNVIAVVYYLTYFDNSIVIYLFLHFLSLFHVYWYFFSSRF